MNNIESIEKEYLRSIHISRQQMVAFVSSLIAGLLAHLYQMTNMLLNCDTVMAYYRMGDPYSFDTLLGNIGNDRWLLPLSEMTISWFNTPVVAGSVILLLCALFSLILVDLFDIKTTVGAITCGAIVSSYPTITSYMSMYSVGYMISAFLSILGLYMLEKKGKIVSTVIIFAIALAIFPVNIMGITVGYIYVLLRKVFTYDKIDKDNLYKPLIRFAVIMLVEGIILLGGMKLRIIITGETPSVYQGADAVASGAFLKDIFSNLVLALSRTRSMRLSLMQQLPKLKFTLRLCYWFQLISIGILFISKRIYTNKEKTILFILAIGTLPFALSAFTVISPEFAYSSQHRMHWVYVFCGTWILVETVINHVLEKYDKQSVTKVCKKIFVVVSANVILMVYGFILFDNMLYFNGQYMIEKDESLMTRILAGLDNTEGFDYSENPVYFFPLIYMATSDTSLSPLAHESELYETMVWDTDSNLWCYGNESFKAHAYKYEGIIFKAPESDIINEIWENNLKFYEQYEGMKSGDFEIVNYKDSGTYVVFARVDMAYSWGRR